MKAYFSCESQNFKKEKKLTENKFIISNKTSPIPISEKKIKLIKRTR